MSLPWRPHAYQLRAAKFLLGQAYGALFLEPGLGKTAITLAVLRTLKAQQQMRKALVVAPLRVCHNVWPVEIAKWQEFSGFSFSLLCGTRKAREKALAQQADLYIINPEGLSWLFQPCKSTSSRGYTRVEVNAAHLQALGFDVLVLDELSLFKHVTSQRFKLLKACLPFFGRRYGLTGSPAANGLLDLFGQCYVIDGGHALGRYITHYRQEFFSLARDGYTWLPQAGAAERIYGRIKPLALSMRAVDYVDMPAVVTSDLLVDMPAAAQAAYTAMRKDMLAELDRGTVTAANAAVKSAKLLQLAAGAVYYEALQGKREYTRLHAAKFDALQELVGELQGSPLLVAYNYQFDIDEIKARFGADVPILGNGVSAGQAEHIIAAWNAGMLPVLFGQPQSMGHGLNLQGKACHIAWLEPTWNYEIYDQFNRRIIRQGAGHDVVYVHHIIAKGTIDEVVLRTLGNKATTQDRVYTALKAHLAEGEKR